MTERKGSDVVIERLVLKDFGKFHDKVLTLQPGLTILYGKNEAGKSTVHSFIRAMLFGLERQRGRAGRDDLYTKYLPWDTPAAYGGSMDFELDGRRYRITRSFHKSQKSVSCICLDTGRDVELPSGKITDLIPELTELSFYYMNLVTVSRLQRNPTVKAEIQMRNFEASIPVGFFCYPISQAADITAFRATHVPVGEDQLPMIEQCREIVHKFNATYGETLTEPDAVLPSNKACLRLPGIDGKAKMSKSLGNCIYLADSSEDLRKKIMSMYTDPNHLRVEDPGQVEGNPVFLYLDAFCRPEYVQEFMPDYASLDEVKAHYQRGGLGDVKVKKFLNSVMQAELGPIRERRAAWEKRIDDVYDILKSGSEKAEKTARAVLDDVRASMQIDYFTDRKLIDMYRV